MGTNYMRIPTKEEMESRKQELIKEITNMEMSPFMIERQFLIPITDNECNNPWMKFIEGTSVHLGKRSAGWKFIWDFHYNKYYSNRDELYSFIRSGRVVDEYGRELNPDEFIEMANKWGEPDGLVLNSQYREKMKNLGWPSLLGDEDDDLIMDGLVVSRYSDFS